MLDDIKAITPVAMNYGLFMGLFWVFKYLFYMFSPQHPFLLGLYWGFTLAVPYILYRMIGIYRIFTGSLFNFRRAWLLGIGIYFFAALIVSLAHYYNFRYMMPSDFMASTINEAVKLLEENQADETIIQAMREIHFTPIQLTLQGILNNTFYGVIVSLPIAAMIYRRSHYHITPQMKEILNKLDEKIQRETEEEERKKKEEE